MPPVSMLMPSVIKDEASRVNSTFRFKSPEEKRLHAWVGAEVQDQIEYATPARQIGTDAIIGYMATVHRSRTYQKNRSDVVFPFLHSVIYNSVALEAATAPRMKIHHRSEVDEPKAKWVEQAIQDSEKGDGYQQPPSDFIYQEQVFDKKLFGVGATYVGYGLQTRMALVRDDRGKIVEKRVTVKDGIEEYNVDFFNFGVSRDMQEGMYRGRACYLDQFYDETTLFKTFGNNPYYQNVSKDKIPDGDWFMGAAGGSVPKPRMWNGVYRVRTFWDIENHLMYVQINGIPVRKDIILVYGNWKDPKPVLPITTIHNDVAFDLKRPSGYEQKFVNQGSRWYTESTPVTTNKSFWSKPDSMIVKPMIAAKNTFGRAAIDYLKASSVHFVIGPTGVIDRINKGRLYGIEPVKLDGGIFETKSLVQGGRYLDDYAGMDEKFSSFMNQALGKDVERPGKENFQQATVEAMQREFEQRRDAQNSRRNSNGGLLRKYWIKFLIVQQYFVQPRKIIVNESGQLVGVDEQRVVRDADGNPIEVLQPKKIRVDTPVSELRTQKTIKIKDPVTGKMITNYDIKYRLVDPGHTEAIAKGKKGSNIITAREDYLLMEVDPEIVIEPLSSWQEDNALQQAVFIEKLQSITPFITMRDAQGQPIIPKEGVLYLLEMAARVFKLDFGRLTGKEPSELDEENEIAPPPQVDGTDVAEGLTSGAAVAPSAPSPGLARQQAGAPPPVPPAAGAVTQTAPQGTPSRAGSSLSQGSALASALSG